MCKIAKTYIPDKHRVWWNLKDDENISKVVKIRTLLLKISHKLLF